jgi:hypothetical protein
MEDVPFLYYDSSDFVYKLTNTPELPVSSQRDSKLVSCTLHTKP